MVGKEALLKAMSEGEALERIYVQNNLSDRHAAALTEQAAAVKVPVSKVPIGKLDSFNAGAHGGFVGLRSKIHYQDLQDVISLVVDSGEAPLFLILDGITDIRNIGGIARTAFCTGVQAIIIPDKGVGMLNEDAVLTSAGALEHLPVCRVNSLLKAVDEFHLNGIKVLASDIKAEKKLFHLDFTEPVALIMGSEEKGIYPALLNAADETFSIPMAGGFESLNVSVATGMILYEALKQRLFTQPKID